MSRSGGNRRYRYRSGTGRAINRMRGDCIFYFGKSAFGRGFCALLSDHVAFFYKKTGTVDFCTCISLKIRDFYFSLAKCLQKMDNSEGQRSFAVGTIAECFPGLKHMAAAFVSQLLPTFLQTGTQDPCSEVRSNCFFGIGELAFYGKEAVYPYPFLLFRNY